MFFYTVLGDFSCALTVMIVLVLLCRSWDSMKSIKKTVMTVPSYGFGTFSCVLIVPTVLLQCFVLLCSDWDSMKSVKKNIIIVLLQGVGPFLSCLNCYDCCFTVIFASMLKRGSHAIHEQLL